MSMFPDPRRIVTGHDDEGYAIVVADSQIPCVPVRVNCNFAELYQTREFPASNDKWEDPMAQGTESLANANGIVLRVVDFKPNTETMLHRTESLDFGLVFEGEMVCVLENGVETTVRAGDVCVQRGTMHAWHNRTDKPARIYFFLSAAKPVTIGDKVLGTTGFTPKEVEVPKN
ncbi:hypothetical protein B0I35DRAFT_160081 [Stachybotrys elegans]|uniref:Cupin type-2 domain-containing protein n=1 Tax=Stachybotrys elegans TaxID=80388 RepID=A0A8K0WTK4_9HYPO|nr:hypothetical protein B0I35DRAFT_160081 [Stachybotrys elegans]